MTEWKKINSKCEICGTTFLKGKNTNRMTCSSVCSTKKWNSENFNKRKKYDTQYSKTHAEKINQTSKKWIENNKEKKLEYDRKYQQKKRAELK